MPGKTTGFASFLVPVICLPGKDVYNVAQKARARLHLESGGSMVLVHLFIAGLVTLIVVLLGLTGIRRSGPWPGVAGFALLIFLASWAGGIWLHPFGPTWWGVFFLPFLVAGIIMAMLMRAFPSQGAERNGPLEKQRKAFWGVVAWVVILALAVVIGAGYFFPAEKAY